MAANLIKVGPGDYNVPGRSAFAVSPNDGVDLVSVTRGVYVGTGGDVAVTMVDGGNVTFAAVPTGTVLAIMAVRVLATGTTATNIVGIY